MKVEGIATIDSEINFGECHIYDVPERIKKHLTEVRRLPKITNLIITQKERECHA